MPRPLEAPLIVQHMTLSDAYDALMALSANARFTTEGDHQALARMSIQDAEAAEVAVQMHPLIKSLQNA